MLSSNPIRPCGPNRDCGRMVLAAEATFMAADLLAFATLLRCQLPTNRFARKSKSSALPLEGSTCSEFIVLLQSLLAFKMFVFALYTVAIVQFSGRRF